MESGAEDGRSDVGTVAGSYGGKEQGMRRATRRGFTFLATQYGSGFFIWTRRRSVIDICWRRSMGWRGTARRCWVRRIYQMKGFSRDKVRVLMRLDPCKVDLANPRVHRKDHDFVVT